MSRVYPDVGRGMLRATDFKRVYTASRAMKYNVVYLRCSESMSQCTRTNPIQKLIFSASDPNSKGKLCNLLNYIIVYIKKRFG